MLTGMHEPIRTIFFLSLFLSVSCSSLSLLSMFIILCVYCSASFFLSLYMYNFSLTINALHSCSSSLHLTSEFVLHLVSFSPRILIMSDSFSLSIFLFLVCLFSSHHPTRSFRIYTQFVRSLHMDWTCDVTICALSSFSLFFPFKSLRVALLAKKLNLPQPRISLIKEHVLKKGLASHDQQVSSS